MILTRKVKIYPSRDVQNKLWGVSYLCKELWNAALEQRRDRKSWGKVNVYSQKKELTQIKKEFPAYKEPSSQVLQNVVFSLDAAFKMFFTKLKNGDKNVRPPKYKSYRYFFTQEYSQNDVTFRINDNCLELAYGSKPADWLQIPFDHQLPACPKTVVITKDGHNWYACVTFEVQEPTHKKTDGHVIYFDPGCVTTLSGIKSTGEFVEYDINPLRQINLSSYKLVDELMSKRDKKKKGSYHWRRRNRQIKAVFRKINGRTKTYLHTLSKRILNDHPDVAGFRTGDWKKQETMADTGYKFVNARINRAVQNNNPVMKLVGYLSYKAVLRGQVADKFDERGSTRTCVMCGHIHKEGVSPDKRTFVCENCEFRYPRDHQSCLNFTKRFLPALWQRLSGNLPDRSVRTTLNPFSFKPQITHNVIRIQNTGCSSIH